MRDSYDFEHDCEIDLGGEAGGQDGPDVYYTTIGISVSLEQEKPRMYEVDYFVKDTPTMDLQSVGGDLFDSVLDRLLADMAADGVDESMLIYP